MFGSLMSMFNLATAGKRFYDANKEKIDKYLGPFIDSCKEAATGVVVNYAEKLPQDTWDNMVEKVDTSEMTVEEQQRAAELAQSFAGVIDSSDKVQMENMQASINENPEAWGQYLENKGITEETINDMQAKIDAGEDISNQDIYQVAVSGCASSVDEKIQAKVEEVKENSNPEATEASEMAEGGETPAGGEQADTNGGASASNENEGGYRSSDKVAKQMDMINNSGMTVPEGGNGGTPTVQNGGEGLTVC